MERKTEDLVSRREFDAKMPAIKTEQRLATIPLRHAANLGQQQASRQQRAQERSHPFAEMQVHNRAGLLAGKGDDRETPVHVLGVKTGDIRLRAAGRPEQLIVGPPVRWRCAARCACG